MIDNHKHAQAGRSLFMSSITGLANVLAVVVTFLATPPLYGETVDWVQRYTARHYGIGYEDVIAFGWFGICILLVFFLSRASIGTALVFGGMALATRFL